MSGRREDGSFSLDTWLFDLTTNSKEQKADMVQGGDVFTAAKIEIDNKDYVLYIGSRVERYDIEANTWYTTPLWDPTIEFAMSKAFTIGNTVYITGGLYSQGLFEFDPKTYGWNEIATMPVNYEWRNNCAFFSEMVDKPIC